MNNRNCILTLLLLVGILFAGCKKNKELEFDRNNVYLQTFPMDGVYIDGNGNFNCTLYGVIQSPYMVDLKEYGFYVTSGSANPDRIVVGSGKKLGLVSASYSSINPISDANVVLFIVFQNGDELKSSDISYNPNGGIQTKLQITQFTLDNTSTPGTALLTSNFTFDPSSGYTLGTYVVGISPAGANTFTPYDLKPFTSAPNYLINAKDLAKDFGYKFTIGSAYDFRIDVMLYPPASNPTAAPIPASQIISGLIIN